MKVRKIFLMSSWVVAALLLQSCATNFYQVYKAKPIDNLSSKDNFYVYEDENCEVAYDLWSEGGNIGFSFHNKTNQNIYVNLAETFFVRNGVAYDYYMNRVYTQSRSSQTSVSKSSKIALAQSSELSKVVGINRYSNGIATGGENKSAEVSSSKGMSISSGFSVAYNEKDIVCIPPHSIKIFREYTVNETLYRDCQLLKFPRNKQIKTLNFTEANSPLVFGNRITYTKGKDTNSKVIKNEFYVNQITNYPETKMLTNAKDEFCGEKGGRSTYLKKGGADEFYIMYSRKNADRWKH